MVVLVKVLCSEDSFMSPRGVEEVNVTDLAAVNLPPVLAHRARLAADAVEVCCSESHGVRE